MVEYFDDQDTDVSVEIKKACQSLAKTIIKRYEGSEATLTNDLLDEYIEMSKILFEIAMEHYNKLMKYLDHTDDCQYFVCSSIDYMSNIEPFGRKNIQEWFKASLETLSELYYSNVGLSPSQKDFLKILKGQIEQNITN